MLEAEEVGKMWQQWLIDKHDVFISKQIRGSRHKYRFSNCQNVFLHEGCEINSITNENVKSKSCVEDFSGERIEYIRIVSDVTNNRRQKNKTKQ